MKFEDIVVIAADTEITPVDLGAFGSRTTLSQEMLSNHRCSRQKKASESGFGTARSKSGRFGSKGRKHLCKRYTEKKIPISEVIRSCYRKGNPITGKVDLMTIIHPTWTQ